MIVRGTQQKAFAKTLRQGIARGVAALSLVLSAACSPSMFSDGDGKDELVTDPPRYRKVNTACANIDLSSPEIDVKIFRKLLHCFNSNGALEPLDQLVTKLKDEQLAPLVAAANSYVLTDRKRLYQLERTHRTLESLGLIDGAISRMGKLISNEEFVANGILLLKEKYFADSGTSAGLRRPDRAILKTLERVGRQLTPARVETGLDLALTAADSRVFGALQDHFRGDRSFRELRKLTDLVLEFLRDRDDPVHANAMELLIEALRSGELFPVLDEITGSATDPAEDVAALRRGIPRLSSVLKATLANDGETLGGILSLFNAVHRPIDCLDGAAPIKDPAFWVLQEVASRDAATAATFVRRDQRLMLASMSSFCQYPASLGENYADIVALAETSAIQPAAEAVKAFFRPTRTAPDGTVTRPMATLLVELLADTGSGATAGRGGVKRLLPLLAELADREAWDDLLLLVHLIQVEHRDKLVATLKFLTEKTPELGGRSIVEIFSDALVRSDPGIFFDFVQSLREFTEAGAPILAPALRDMRASFYVNDVHPVLDLARQVLTEASRNEPLFTTLFQMSEMPEFRETIKLFSEMAQDGRLRDLVGACFTLFHRFAAEDQTPIHATEEPPFVPKRRHNLTAAELEPFPLVPEPAEANEACQAVDLNLRLGDLAGPELERELGDILSCRNSDGRHQDWLDRVEFLKTARTSKDETFLSWGIRMLRELRLEVRELSELVRATMAAFDDGRLFRLLDALPFWVNRGIDGDETALRPLLSLARPLAPLAAGELHRLEAAGASVLEHERFPQVLGFGRALWDIKPAPVADLPKNYDLPAIKDAVGRAECEKSEAGRAARAGQIIRDYEEAITNPDLYQGVPRREWDEADLKGRLDPVLDVLAQPRLAGAEWSALQGLLRFMNAFTLEKGQAPNQLQRYTPEYFREWIQARSDDRRLIRYIYDGDPAAQPRARLVSSLDRFELILINADFVAPVLKRNFGLQFLAQIGEAWGDEPRERWPTAIQAKFKSGTRPQTLAEANEDIQSTQKFFQRLIGKVKFKCRNGVLERTSEDGSYEHAFRDSVREKALRVLGEETVRDLEERVERGSLDTEVLKHTLFNISQVKSVLDENLPGAEGPHAGGLKVFRDLFFELLYSTPAQYRNPKAGLANHLSVAIRLVRLGVGRLAAKHTSLLPLEDPALDDFYRGLVAGATAPGIERVLNALLTQPGRELIWKTAHLFFSLSEDDARTARTLFFHGLASMRALDLVDPGVASLAPAFPGALPYLTRHFNRLESLLRSERIGQLLQALHEADRDGNGNDGADRETRALLGELLRTALQPPREGPTLAQDALAILAAIDQDTAAVADWDKFLSRWDRVTAEPEYARLGIPALLGDVLAFFEETGSAAEAATARRLRLYAAERLRSGELDELLLLARKNPDEAYRLLQTLGRSIENGELKDFLGMARRGLKI